MNRKIVRVLGKRGRITIPYEIRVRNKIGYNDMVEIFADEGISGMKAKNRPEFQRMIRMCELHQLDLIITKSVSRFARNVKEALEYVRKLKLLGVGIIFEKEGMCLSITHGLTERSCDDGKILQTNFGRLLCGFLHEFQQRLLLKSWIRRRR